MNFGMRLAAVATAMTLAVAPAVAQKKSVKVILKDPQGKDAGTVTFKQVKKA